MDYGFISQRAWPWLQLHIVFVFCSILLQKFSLFRQIKRPFLFHYFSPTLFPFFHTEFWVNYSTVYFAYFNFQLLKLKKKCSQFSMLTFASILFWIDECWMRDFKCYEWMIMHWWYFSCSFKIDFKQIRDESDISNNNQCSC